MRPLSLADDKTLQSRSGYTSSAALAWLSAIVENSDDAILSKTLDGIITTWNPGATRLFGFSAEEAVGRHITIIIPEDRASEEEEIIGRLRRGDRVHHFETVRRRKDGSLVDISLTVSPVRDRRGRIIGASKIARDITEARLASERQNLLLREMNHRIKNLFALTGGLVALSARAANSVEQLAGDISERIKALGRAHSLTLPDLACDLAPGETTMRGVLEAILAPYAELPASHIHIAGGDVQVVPRCITPLALLFHELATNAAKYGALSATGERLDIAIDVQGDEIAIMWRERSTRVTNSAPTHEGFGNHLEKASIRGLNGFIEREWNGNILSINIRFPLNRLQA